MRQHNLPGKYVMSDTERDNNYQEKDTRKICDVRQLKEIINK